MASFTDLSPISFNPYIQQLPVEAMTSVGIEKQRRYDVGVEKIQSAIDNIAGLDIIKDPQKQYLQSKLGEVGNNLKAVAMGDFSNNQLVNSMTGMVGRIGKDPIIQGAVLSTRVIRKGQTDIQEARKAGKSSVVNEAYWNNEVNDWLSDGKIDSQFNTPFTQFIDVDKKLREIADKIHETDRSIDIPYKRDAQGNTLYFGRDSKGKSFASIDPSSGGTPQVDEAMLRIKSKGKSAEKILDNFYTSLNDDDINQLRMNSWYHYRGATADAFKSDIRRNYNEKKEMLSQTVVDLNTELVTGKNLSSTDKAAIQAKINNINQKLSDGSLEKEMVSDIAAIDSSANIEDYKYKIYTQKYLTNLAKDLSYESYEQSYETNPYEQAREARERLNFQYWNANREQRNFETNLEWDKAKFFVGEQNKKTANQPIVTPDRVPTDINAPSVISLDKDIKTEAAAINDLTTKYIPYVTNSSLKTDRERKAYLDRLAAEYAKDPSFLNTQSDPNLTLYLRQRRAREIVLAQKQNLMKSVDKNSEQYNIKLNKMFAEDPGVRFTNGNTLYTSKELFEFETSLSDFYVSTFAGPYSISSVKLDVDALMNKYEGTKYEPLARAYRKSYESKPMTDTEKVLVKRANEVFSKFRMDATGIIDEKLKSESSYLSAHMPERQRAIGTLDIKNNKEDAHSVESLIGNTKTKYADGTLDVRTKVDYNPKTLDEIKEKPGANFSVIKEYDANGEIKGSLVVSLGEKRQIIPMTPGEFRAYFPNYSRTNSMDDIKYAVLASPEKTTNFENNKTSSGAVNAFMTGYELPLLADTELASRVRLDVDGAPDNNGGGNDLFAIRLYVNTNDGWKQGYVTGNTFVSEGKMLNIIRNIGVNTVEDILKLNK